MKITNHFRNASNSARSRIRSHAQVEQADECDHHLEEGVSHRETINTDARERRAMRAMFPGEGKTHRLEPDYYD